MTAAGPDRGRSQTPARRAWAVHSAGDEPLDRVDRAGERAHAVQRDPRRARRADARLRRLAGCALPLHHRRQLGDRDRAGAAGEALARPAGRARRAEGDGRARRRGAATSRSSRSSRATSSASRPATRWSRTAPLAESTGLALDESILTGESRAVQREPGEEVRSGSFAVEGAGSYTRRGGRATRATRRSWRARRASSGIRARRSRSRSTTCSTRSSALMVPLGLMLLVVLVKGDSSTREAITTAVAAIVTLVPEGLILLMSVTFAAAALQLSRRGALAQQLNAIESLASVDLICLDKTGTLTEPGLRVVSLEPADGVEVERLRDELARFAASSPSKNGTLIALAQVATRPRRRRARRCRSRPRGAGARCGSATRASCSARPSCSRSGRLRHWRSRSSGRAGEWSPSARRTARSSPSTAWSRSASPSSPRSYARRRATRSASSRTRASSSR